MRLFSKPLRKVLLPLSLCLSILCSCSQPTSSSSSSSSSNTTTTTIGSATDLTTPEITISTPASGAVTLSWSAVNKASSYNLYYSAGTTVNTSTATKISGITSTSQLISGLTNDTEYAFELTAVDSTGESATSAVFTDTPPYFGSDVPDYPVDGKVTTNIDSDVPSWIKNNFTNIRAYMSGTTIVIETRDLPPYSSYYYSATSTSTGFSALHQSTTPDFPDPNMIAEQAYILKVPETPTESTSSVTAGLGPVGIAKNGVMIFNADAAPGDYIQNEYFSFDTTGGHPQSSGVYHYHTEPASFVTSSGDEVVGIALDGFPIYGGKNSSGTVVFNAGGNSSAATTSWNVDNTNWVSSTADTSLTSLPHYHTVENYYLATTEAAGSTNPAGTIIELNYLLGTYLGGAKGTITNEGQ